MTDNTAPYIPQPTNDDSILRVENLSVSYPSLQGTVHAVSNISFNLGRQKLGIVGESGSGKSTVGKAIMNLIRPPGIVTADRLDYMGKSVLGISEAESRALCGSEISMVMQDPRISLNPVMTVGKQILESLYVHDPKMNKKVAKERVCDILNAVRIRHIERVYKAYPHELSGGMGQRVMIAMMLVTNPKLLIADEPTSALDVTVQMQVLSIIDDLVSERGTGLIFISHDLQLVGSFCDHVLIMYGGRIMESLPAADLHKCRHGYSRGLLASLPDIENPVEYLSTLQRQDEWLTPGLADNKRTQMI